MEQNYSIQPHVQQYVQGMWFLAYGGPGHGLYYEIYGVKN